MQEKIENLLNETKGELIRAFNSGYLWEWLQSNALEVNIEEKEILLAYGGPTIWIDLTNSKLCFHYGAEEAVQPINNELNTQLLQYFEEINQYKGEVQ